MTAKRRKPAPGEKAGAKSNKSSGNGEVKVDGLFAALAQDHRRRLGGDGYHFGVDREKHVIGVPLPAFAVRWLFQNSCWPLGGVTIAYGPPESMKTAFGYECARWHVMVPGGGLLYQHTEERDQISLREAIIGHEYKPQIEAIGCKTIEAVQASTEQLLRRMRAQFPEEGSCPFPVMITTDSVMGSSTEAVRKQTRKEGSTPRVWGVEAGQWSRYFKTMPGDLIEWPFTWFGINHEKEKQNRYGHNVGRRAGGSAFDFHSSFEFRVVRFKQYRGARRAGYVVQITSTKVLGPLARQKLLVNMSWDLFEEPQRIVWDWHSASIEVLLSLPGPLKKVIRDIFDLSVTGEDKDRITSKKLGFKDVYITEAGAALEEDPEVCRQLDQACKIIERTPFRPKVPYDLQVRQLTGRPKPPRQRKKVDRDREAVRRYQREGEEGENGED